MCEAFNATFKRDYVYESCLDNSQTVLGQIQKWINEYNTYAPHSALGMKTPNEFYNFKNRCITSPTFKRKEHILVGTLFSFALAILTGLIIQWLLNY